MVHEIELQSPKPKTHCGKSLYEITYDFHVPDILQKVNKPVTSYYDPDFQIFFTIQFILEAVD